MNACLLGKTSVKPEVLIDCILRDVGDLRVSKRRQAGGHTLVGVVSYSAENTMNRKSLCEKHPSACKCANLCHAAGRVAPELHCHHNATAYGNVLPAVQTADPPPPTGS